MIVLQPDECRVLGVMVEKALTTPRQYPMSTNAIALGCTQKNNRLPVEHYDEFRVAESLDTLIDKGLVSQVHTASGRVPKYKQNARELYNVSTPELVVIVELMLRGPQTMGELRGRASRMSPLESIAAVRGVLNNLINRNPAMAREFPPIPGTRAETYMQLLCPDLHPLGYVPQGFAGAAGGVAASTISATSATSATAPRVPDNGGGASGPESVSSGAGEDAAPVRRAAQGQSEFKRRRVDRLGRRVEQTGTAPSAPLSRQIIVPTGGDDDDNNDNGGRVDRAPAESAKPQAAEEKGVAQAKVRREVVAEARGVVDDVKPQAVINAKTQPAVQAVPPPVQPDVKVAPIKQSPATQVAPAARTSPTPEQPMVAERAPVEQAPVDAKPQVVMDETAAGNPAQMANQTKLMERIDSLEEEVMHLTTVLVKLCEALGEDEMLEG